MSVIRCQRTARKMGDRAHPAYGVSYGERGMELMEWSRRRDEKPRARFENCKGLILRK